MRTTSSSIPVSHNPAWSHSFVEDVDPPELATNEEWRRTMRKARKDHVTDGKSMTQGDLAEAIWKVMRQRWPQSKHSAEAPSHYVDDDNRAWAEAGEYMRHKFPEEFARHLEMLEERMRSEKAKEEATTEDQPPSKR